MPRTRNIVVVGSGAAGLTAALSAAPSGDCVLVTDGPLGRSNSVMAQGGLQLPLATAESRQRFFDDIMRSARVALDEALVRNFVGHVEETVARLEAWGLELDRNGNGELVRRLAGGLSEPRIVSTGDQIGPAIIKVLRARVRESPVEVLEHTEVTDLRPADGGFTLTLRDARGDAGALHARAVVCCTGGITFREAQRRHEPTTNPESRNHVLYDVLCGLGLTRVHADYFQYQPFGIVGSERDGVGRCVPESIVNFGVDILDRSGTSIGDIRQDRLALTRRMFEVTAAGGAERTADGRPGLRLTLGDVDAAKIAEVFPKVHQYLAREGLLGRHILVHPFLHYYLGGLRITPRCESEIPGLFLAGEITGGLHGRNRLMGNGITDSLVHGDIAGRSVREYLAG